MPPAGHSLAELNTCPPAAFVAALGGVFEASSPWVAGGGPRPAAVPGRRAPGRRIARRDARRSPGAAAGPHPEAHPTTWPSGWKASRQPRSAGAEAGAPASIACRICELAEFQRLNSAYRARFGFPFVICARLNAKEAILGAMRRRLEHEPAAEEETALAEIEKIAALRLADILQST